MKELLPKHLRVIQGEDLTLKQKTTLAVLLGINVAPAWVDDRFNIKEFIDLLAFEKLNDVKAGL